MRRCCYGLMPDCGRTSEQREPQRRERGTREKKEASDTTLRGCGLVALALEFSFDVVERWCGSAAFVIQTLRMRCFWRERRRGQARAVHFLKAEQYGTSRETAGTTRVTCGQLLRPLLIFCKEDLCPPQPPQTDAHGDNFFRRLDRCGGRPLCRTLSPDEQGSPCTLA